MSIRSLAVFCALSIEPWRFKRRLAIRLLLPMLIAVCAANQALAAKNPQTIDFAPLPNRIFGAAPFAISATASSGLTVAFASKTKPVCTVGGSTVTIVAAGTCSVEASQSGHAQFAAAPSVSRSFEVAKAGQAIAFAPLADKPIGTPPFAIAATASSGLGVTFVSASSAICTVNSGKVTIVATGTCSIDASQGGNNNYNAAPSVRQSFNVAKLVQSITFAALANRILGSAPFAVAATASSGLVVTFTSLAPAVCTVSGTTVALVAVGTCFIRGAQAGDSSYAPAPNVDRSFEVTGTAAIKYLHDGAGNVVGIQRTSSP